MLYSESVWLCYLPNYLVMQGIILNQKNDVTAKTIDTLIIILSIKVCPFPMI